jgi:hypothetical protein
MKDLVTKRSKHLDIPLVLETIKERMIEFRFNIDEYNNKTGRIIGRRNNLDKVILGLYRKVSIQVSKEKIDLSIEVEWSGLKSAGGVSAFQFFIVSFAILRNLGAQGMIISLLMGALGVFLNLVAFFALRGRMISRMKRDLNDLEKAEREKRKRSKMDGF